MWFKTLKSMMKLAVLLYCGACSAQSNNNNNNVEDKFNGPVLTCENGKHLTVDEWGQPNCIDVDSENVCLLEIGGFEKVLKQGDENLFNSCLTLRNQANNTVLGLTRLDTTIYLKTTYKEKLKFAKWADANNDILRNKKSFMTTDYFGEQLHVGTKTISDVARGILDPILMPHERQTHLFLPMAPKYFAEVQDLIEYLSGTFDVDFRSSNPAVNELVSLNQATQPTTSLSETESELECLATCIKKSQPINTPQGFAQKFEYYSYNELYRAEWTMKNDSGDVQAFLYLAGEQPSLATVIERDPYGLAKSAKTFNKNEEVVFSSNYTIKSEKLLKERNRMTSYQNHKRPMAAICEGDLDTDDFFNLTKGDKILLGPHTDESFYGWVRPTVNEGLFFDGRLISNQLGLNFSQQGTKEHSSSVAMALGRNRRMGVIPLTSTSCTETEKTKTWWPAFKASGAKVINLSSRATYDEPSCRKMMVEHPILKEPGAALWVVAAGNQKSDKPTGCPQYFNGRRNIIIVGASSGRYPHPESNYGAHFVDIYTNGDDYDGQGWGTSFAAPRVAGVAAKVFHEYPTLSVFEVKLAILLTVDQHKSLPSRSSGNLDETNVYEMASAILENEGDIEEAIDNVYWRKEERKKRKEIYSDILKGEFL